MTTLNDFGGVLGQPSDTFVWALTILWSRLLACVRSGPKLTNTLANRSHMVHNAQTLLTKGQPI